MVSELWSCWGRVCQPLPFLCGEPNPTVFGRRADHYGVADVTRTRSKHRLQVDPQGSLVVPFRDTLHHPGRTSQQDCHAGYKGRFGPYLCSQDCKLGMAAVRKARLFVPSPNCPSCRQLSDRLHDPSAVATSCWILAGLGTAGTVTLDASYYRCWCEECREWRGTECLVRWTRSQRRCCWRHCSRRGRQASRAEGSDLVCWGVAG